MIPNLTNVQKDARTQSSPESDPATANAADDLLIKLSHLNTYTHTHARARKELMAGIGRLTDLLGFICLGIIFLYDSKHRLK